MTILAKFLKIKKLSHTNKGNGCRLGVKAILRIAVDVDKAVDLAGSAVSHFYE